MKLKSVKILFVLILLNASVFAQTKMTDAKLSREMVGIWQNMPTVGAGMSDLYRFFSNGNFVFEYNQMVWSKRNISYSGKWKIKNGRMILTILQETKVVGGKRIKSEMSADGYEIEDGKNVIRKALRIQMENLGKLRRGELTKLITIGKRKYWQLSQNPKDYRN